MFPSDPTVQVAIIGVLTTVITTSGVIAVAFVNTRRERASGAAGESPSLVAALEKTIKLQEAENEHLVMDRRALRRRVDELIAQNEEKDALIDHLTSGELSAANGAVEIPGEDE